MRVDITVTREFSRRRTPRGRVRATSQDVRGGTAVREEPDVDAVALPLGGIDPAIGLVESTAVGLVAGTGNGTAGVGCLVRRFNVTVARVEMAAEAGVVDRAAGAGVQGHLVGCLLVHAFDDVDLAVVRPVRAEHPAVNNQHVLSVFFGKSDHLQGRPGSTDTSRHVCQV